MDFARSSKPLSGGMERNAALETFRERCNTPETLFITDLWFAPRRERLLRLLSDPISDEQAKCLLDALDQKAHLDAVVEWLSLTTKGWFASKPIRWEQYPKRNREATSEFQWRWEEVDVCRSDTALQNKFRDFVDEDSGEPAFDVNYTSAEARPCPECGDTFDQLACFWYTTSSLSWTEKVWKGWMACSVRPMSPPSAILPLHNELASGLRKI